MAIGFEPLEVNGVHVVGRGMTVEQLEQLLRDGVGLTPGLVARVLGRPATTVNGWVNAGATPQGDQLRSETDASGYRLCNPEDVLAILAKYRGVAGP